ncbi:hypothetical protein BGZ72_003272 [Mortierella alpina]|nr:hypothetical protein BGZ72_003272 [Mortierella alpina]
MAPYSVMPAVSPQADAFTTGTFPQPSRLQQDMNSKLYQQSPLQPCARQGGPLSPELQNTMQQLQIDASLHQQAHAPFTQSPASLDPQLPNPIGVTKEKKSRRWSLAGRFFDKRKSITEPFNIPNSHPQSFAATYNSGNSNIVGLPSNNNERGSQPQPTASGESSACNSHSGSRRSSIVDIPKAFLSSLRRGSLTSNTGSTSSNNSSSHNTAILGEEDNEDDGDDEIEAPVVTILLADGLRQATMATLKSPPRDPKSHSQSLELRSILKKRSSPAPSTGSAASGDSGANANGVPHLRHHRLSPHDVHPMATTDSNVDLSLLPPRNHRAALVTRSPVPHHPSQQQQMLSPSWSSNIGSQGSPIPARLRPSPSFDPNGLSVPSMSAGPSWMPAKLGSPISADQRYMSQGAAIPPDFTPGVQANVYQDRGGERSQGAVYDNGPAMATDHTMLSPRFVHMQQYQQPMMSYISPRAQDLSAQYYSAVSQDPFSQQMAQGRFQYHDSSNQQNSMSDDPMVTAQQSSKILMMESYGGTSSEGDNGMQTVLGLGRKTLSFMDTIEIIPAHRKSEYNRRSDKNATFRILTPDMKSEIRDELNIYKMREMAVHVDSMGNTAFH